MEKYFILSCLVFKVKIFVIMQRWIEKTILPLFEALNSHNSGSKHIKGHSCCRTLPGLSLVHSRYIMAISGYHKNLPANHTYTDLMDGLE